MLDAIQNRNFRKIERAYTVKAGDVDTVLRLIGTPLVMRINAAARAEEMLGSTGIEAIAR